MRPSRSKRLVVREICLLAVLVGGTACGDIDLVCPGALFEDNLRVEVVDGETGAPVAEGATGHARSETLQVRLEPGPENANGVIEELRATVLVGTYEVTVAKSGYRTWVREGVVVEAKNACMYPAHVILTAALVPAP